MYEDLLLFNYDIYDGIIKFSALLIFLKEKFVSFDNKKLNTFIFIYLMRF